MDACFVRGSLNGNIKLAHVQIAFGVYIPPTATGDKIRETFPNCSSKAIWICNKLFRKPLLEFFVKLDPPLLKTFLVCSCTSAKQIASIVKTTKKPSLN